MTQTQTKRFRGAVWFTVVALMSVFVPVTSRGAACTVQSGNICAEANAGGSTGIVGEPLGVSVQIMNTVGSLADMIVDLEIYDSANQKVHQQFFEHQNLGNYENKTYQISWTPLTTGRYVVRGGVFTGSWSSNASWWQEVVSFDVQDKTNINPSVQIWWPTDGLSLEDAQPFKAVAESRSIHDYHMFWQVDGGQWNTMETKTTDGPHKESWVDVSDWNWRSNGPYTINFIVTDTNWKQIGEKSVSIFVDVNPQSEVSTTAIPPLVGEGQGGVSASVDTPVDSLSTTPVITTQPTPQPPSSGIQMTVSNVNTHPISPFIYGTNFQGDPNSWDGESRNLTLARFGGNRLTTYNWENNASNAGSDWQQQNDGYLGGGDTPAGAVIDRIRIAHNADAAALVTVPIQGYVAEDKRGDGDVTHSPDYLNTRFERTLPQKGSSFSSAPDQNDGVVYQDEFVSTLEKQFPYAVADATKKIFYSLDNEPDLWSGTHPRIQSSPVTYTQLAEASIDFARAIKAVNPSGLIFGAANYGWQGFETLQNASDAGGRNFIRWYLEQMAGAERSAGRRLLDVLDIHWYPEAQGGGRRIIEDDSGPDIAYARIQAPRSLWDANYREQSWIADNAGPIALLPTLKRRIQESYPGTKLAVSEYYYGGGNHISGAIAQADVLGIFGREDVFAANLWHIGNTDDRFIYGAFAMYRSFDGQEGTFGDISVSAVTSNNEKTSLYASLHSQDQNRMTLVAINKTNEPQPVTIQINHPTSFGRASIYELTSVSAIPVSSGSQIVNGNTIVRTLPPMSVSTMVLFR